MAGVELVRGPGDEASRSRRTGAMGARVCRLCRERGVLLRPLGDVVVVMPPLAIDWPLLDRLGDVLYNAVQEVVANG